MKLMTKELEKQFEKYPLYSQEKKIFDAKVIVKYFCPYNGAYWFITEGEKQDDGDWLFFGYGYQGYWEWGYVTLKYLENYKAKAFGVNIPNAVERDLWLDKNATVRSCLKDVGANIDESLINEKENNVLYYSKKIPKDADLENDEREIEYFLSYENGDCDAAGYSDYKRVENMAIDYLADSMDDSVVYVIKDVFHRTKRGTRYHTEQDYDDCKIVTEVKWVGGRIKACKIDEKLTSDSNIKLTQKLTESFKLNDDNVVVPYTEEEEKELEKKEDNPDWVTDYKGHCPWAYYEYDNEDGQNKGLYFYDDTFYDDDSVYDNGTYHYGIWHEFDLVQDGFDSIIESRYREDEEEKPKAIKMVAYCVPETEESFKAHSGDPIVDKTKKPFLIYEYTWDDKENAWKLTAYEGDGTHPKFDPKLKNGRYELDWEEATETEEDLDEKIETQKNTIQKPIWECDRDNIAWTGPNCAPNSIFSGIYVHDITNTIPGEYKSILVYVDYENEYNCFCGSFHIDHRNEQTYNYLKKYFSDEEVDQIFEDCIRTAMQWLEKNDFFRNVSKVSKETYDKSYMLIPSRSGFANCPWKRVPYREHSTTTTNEKLETHDTLNPILFDDNKELISEVKDKLEKIVENYVSEVKNRGDNKIDVPIKDVVLVGSNVSYNYTSKSDIDLHIVINTDQLEEDKIDFYSIIYNDCRSIYNNKHDLKIKGTPVEISIEMGEVSVESNGIYSLNTGWIKEPTKNDNPEINEEAYEKEFKKWEERYLDIIKPYFKMAEEEITEPSTEETIEENLKEVWYGTPNYRNYNKEQPYKDQITYIAVSKDGRTEEVSYITASPGLIKQVEHYATVNRIYAFHTSDVNKYKRLISKAGLSDREASDKLLKDLKKAGVPYGAKNTKAGKSGAYLEAELRLEYPETKNKENEVEK